MPSASDRSGKKIAVGSIFMGLAVFIMEYGGNIIIDEESAHNNVGWYAISGVIAMFLTCCLAYRLNRRSPQRIIPLDEKKPDVRNAASQPREDSAWIVAPADMPANSEIPAALPPSYVPPSEESQLRIQVQGEAYRVLNRGMFPQPPEEKSVSQLPDPIGLGPPRLAGSPV